MHGKYCNFTNFTSDTKLIKSEVADVPEFGW